MVGKTNFDFPTIEEFKERKENDVQQDFENQTTQMLGEG